ncbi:MAG: DUF4912 domain-containing protein [Acidobacteriota bacterium]|nr:DUF4912 domain-containing protein [Acidobacteriota bacterium]
MNEIEDLEESIKNQEHPTILPQSEPGDATRETAEQSENTSEETDETSESEAKSETGLLGSLAAIADSVLEKIEPVIEPVEEAVKETIVEPILEAIAPLHADEPQPVSSGENYKFYDAAETSVLTKTQPYDVQEIDAAEIAKTREIREKVEETIDEEELLDPLGFEALPQLPVINRARLQVQSPNRVFLYWSLAGNPFATLQKAFGNRATNYNLVLKFRNLSYGGEQIFPVEREGNWWFDVQPNARFQVDVGLFAPNRPFIRLMSSNAVETPRSTPSQRVDTEADWQISRVQFARVLDISGYTHDALPVVFGFGEDSVFDEMATVAVLNQLSSNAPAAPETFDLAEMRVALAALAAGVVYEDLRGQLSTALRRYFDSLLQQDAEALTTEKVLSALQAVFGDEFVEEFAGFDEELQRIQLEPVWGASAVHFPEIALPRIFRQLSENPSPKFSDRLINSLRDFPTSPVR